jgi:predicted AAA+ superfamily ATPase
MGDTRGYQPRLADVRLRHLVATFPAVLVNGPRGAGKTTTAEQVCASVVHLDLPGAAAAFRADPDAALRTLEEPALIDEWQEVPEVLGAVKRAVDDNSRPGRFVLTGSVRADLEQKMWPGTGRLVRIAMYGLTEREIVGKLDPDRPSFLDRLAAANLDEIIIPPVKPDLVGYISLALRGGLPEVALRDWPEEDRATWMDSYLEQLLTRDVAALERAPREPENLRRYFEATALNTAGIPTGKTLYEAAGITAKTATSYDHLLASLFVLDRVPAWSTNRLARLVTLPKRYVVDPGLVGSAVGMTTRSVLANGDILGRLVDTFTLAQLRPEMALTARRHRPYHLRSQGGRHEIDLVVELEAGNVLGIEIKATAAPNHQDAKHLRWLRDELGDRFLCGAVLHTGPYAFPLDDRIFAIPICAIWG